jgi:hypothetical protein
MVEDHNPMLQFGHMILQNILGHFYILQIQQFGLVKIVWGYLPFLKGDCQDKCCYP